LGTRGIPTDVKQEAYCDGLLPEIGMSRKISIEEACEASLGYHQQPTPHALFTNVSIKKHPEQSLYHMEKETELRNIKHRAVNAG
jgi:hypothetical protein